MGCGSSKNAPAKAKPTKIPDGVLVGDDTRPIGALQSPPISLPRPSTSELERPASMKGVALTSPILHVETREDADPNFDASAEEAAALAELQAIQQMSDEGPSAMEQELLAFVKQQEAEADVRAKEEAELLAFVNREQAQAADVEEEQFAREIEEHLSKELRKHQQGTTGSNNVDGLIPSDETATVAKYDAGKEGHKLVDDEEKAEFFEEKDDNPEQERQVRDISAERHNQEMEKHTVSGNNQTLVTNREQVKNVPELQTREEIADEVGIEHNPNEDFARTADADGVGTWSKSLEAQRTEPEDLAKSKLELLEEERFAAEEASRQEAQRIAAEEAARLEAEQIAAEEAARQEAQRIAAEEAARLEAEQIAADEAARQEAQRIAAEEAARLEAEQIAAEEAARQEAQRIAAEEAARLEAEQIAADEAARQEAQRIAAEEAARLEAEKRAAEEAVRLEAEQIAAEEAARLETEKLAAEAALVEAERLQLEEQARQKAERLEAERLAAQEMARLEAERMEEEEATRLEAERIAKLEAVRLEAEQKAEEAARLEEAARIAVLEDAKLKADREAKEEADRMVAEKNAAESAKIEAERQATSEAARLEAQRQATEEAARLEAESKIAAEVAQIEAERKIAQDTARFETERITLESEQAERQAAADAAQSAQQEYERVSEGLPGSSRQKTETQVHAVNQTHLAEQDDDEALEMAALAAAGVGIAVSASLAKASDGGGPDSALQRMPSEEVSSVSSTTQSAQTVRGTIEPFPATTALTQNNVALTAQWVIALYDYQPDDISRELRLERGEMVEVVDSSDPDWWLGRTDQGEGLFPQSYVRILEREGEEQSKNENDEEAIESKTQPVPYVAGDKTSASFVLVADQSTTAVGTNLNSRLEDSEGEVKDSKNEFPLNLDDSKESRQETKVTKIGVAAMEMAPFYTDADTPRLEEKAKENKLQDERDDRIRTLMEEAEEAERERLRQEVESYENELNGLIDEEAAKEVEDDEAAAHAAEMAFKDATLKAELEKERIRKAELVEITKQLEMDQKIAEANSAIITGLQMVEDNNALGALAVFQQAFNEAQALGNVLLVAKAMHGRAAAYRISGDVSLKKQSGSLFEGAAAMYAGEGESAMQEESILEASESYKLVGMKDEAIRCLEWYDADLVKRGGQPKFPSRIQELKAPTAKKGWFFSSS